MTAFKAAHLGGITLLLLSVLVMDLRLLGLGRGFPVRRLAARVLPWSAASFLLIVPSGLAMFVAHPALYIASPILVLKFSLIFAAAANAAVFQLGVFRSSAAWDVGAMPPPAARAAAALSLLLWLSVAACGLALAAARAAAGAANP